MKKNVFAIILILLFLLALTGCQKKEGSNSGTENPSGSPEVIIDGGSQNDESQESDDSSENTDSEDEDSSMEVEEEYDVVVDEGSKGGGL